MCLAERALAVLDPDRYDGLGQLSEEKYALETLPQEIESLRDQIAALEATLSDADLYSRDPTAFEAASNDLSSLEIKLAEAEDQWLELKLLRETIEEA